MSCSVPLLPILLVSQHFALTGFFEASIPPCWIYITSMFYRADEQGLRCIGWYFMVDVPNIGRLLVTTSDTSTRLLSSGSLSSSPVAASLCSGRLLWDFLPDSPLNARFLKERERLIALERLRDNWAGAKSTEFRWPQVRQAVIDP